MALDIGSATRKALKFAFTWENFLVIFTLNLAIFAAFGLVVYRTIKMALIGIGAWTVLLGGSMLLLASVVIVGAVLLIWLNLCFTKKYEQGKSLSKAIEGVKGMFWKTVGVSIIVGIISGTIRKIPVLGWILQILISIVMVFMIPIIVIGKKSFEDVFRDSIKGFRKRPERFVAVWDAKMLVGIGIFILSVIPLVIVISKTIGIGAIADVFTSMTVLKALMANSLSILLGLVIVIVGFTIIGLFSAAFMADTYMQMKKK